MSGELWAESIAHLVASWQRILRLEDWDITLRIVRARDHEPGERAFASITGDRLSKTARMDFVNPIDWAEETRTVQDIDDTVGHELVHLYFRQAGIEIDDDEKEEIVVRAVMRAVMGLRHGGDQARNDDAVKVLRMLLEQLS